MDQTYCKPFSLTNINQETIIEYIKTIPKLQHFNLSISENRLYLKKLSADQKFKLGDMRIEYKTIQSNEGAVIGKLSLIGLVPCEMDPEKKKYESDVEGSQPILIKKSNAKR